MHASARIRDALVSNPSRNDSSFQRLFSMTVSTSHGGVLLAAMACLLGARPALALPQVQAPPPAPVQSQILTQRVGSAFAYQGPSLVQVCIGVNPPAPPTALPQYTIDSVPCDVFPISRDSQGLVTAAHLVARLASTDGLPAIPGAASGTPPVLLTASVPPASPQVITLPGLAGLTLTVDPSNAPAMECRPFDATFLGRLNQRTTLNGNYIVQTITASQFVPVGATSIASNQDTALVVYAVITHRSDLPAATVDFVIANGAYDPTYNVLTNPDTTSPTAGGHGGHPNGANSASDGPFFFGSIGFHLNSSSLRAVLFAPRPGSFQDPGTNFQGPFDVVARPAEPPPGGPAVTQVNVLMPGDFFVRRFCVYQPSAFPAGTNPRALAADIVDRRDFGWAVGPIGYMAGGYTPATWKTPDLAFLQYTVGGITHSGWQAVHERGKTMEAAALADLAAPLFTTPYQQCGWLKPPPETDSIPPGEYHVEFGGYTWPSNGEMKARLLWGDRYAERSHVALVDVAPGAARGWPVTDTAYARQGGGKFPTGFAGENAPHYFVPPQHSLPTVAVPATSAYWTPPVANAAAGTLQTPTLGLPWNKPNLGASPAEYCPYIDILNWQHNSPGSSGTNAYYGPLAWSHISKPVAHWRANAYGLNDASSWLALEFQAHAYSFAAGRFDVTQTITSGVAGNRFGYGRWESNLFAFANSFLPITPPQAGYWLTTPTTGMAPAGARSRINGWAALACHYAHADDSERLRYTLDHLGNTAGGANDLRALLHTFFTYVSMPSGMMFSNDGDVGAPSPYQGGSYDVATLTGPIPGDIPGPGYNTGNPRGQWWAHTLISQQAYGHAALQGLEHSMLRGTPWGGAFDGIAQFAENFAKSAASYTATNKIHFNQHLPTKRGTDGNLNPTPTLAQYQNGDLFWMFTTPPATPIGNRVELFALLAAWKINSLGLLTPDMRNAIRRLYDIPASTPAAQDAAVRLQLRNSFTWFTNNGYQNLADHLVPLLAIY